MIKDIQGKRLFEYKESNDRPSKIHNRFVFCILVVSKQRSDIMMRSISWYDKLKKFNVAELSNLSPLPLFSLAHCPKDKKGLLVEVTKIEKAEKLRLELKQ